MTLVETIQDHRVPEALLLASLAGGRIASFTSRLLAGLRGLLPRLLAVSLRLATLRFLRLHLVRLRFRGLSIGLLLHGLSLAFFRLSLRFG